MRARKIYLSQGTNFPKDIEYFAHAYDDESLSDELFALKMSARRFLGPIS